MAGLRGRGGIPKKSGPTFGAHIRRPVPVPEPTFDGLAASAAHVPFARRRRDDAEVRESELLGQIWLRLGVWSAIDSEPALAYIPAVQAVFGTSPTAPIDSAYIDSKNCGTTAVFGTCMHPNGTCIRKMEAEKWRW
jgi:hypothetical protein